MVDDGNHGPADQLDCRGRIAVGGQRELGEPEALELEQPPDTPVEAPPIGGPGPMLDPARGAGGRRGAGGDPGSRPSKIARSIAGCLAASSRASASPSPIEDAMSRM